ncbi:hypothetical protein C0J50_19433 [Silurus asotus]|uniref:Alkylated DNA repair protein AlkB homologue 8 N-terminal domain-containing protein n=1 Tax=Silurus asotus TaxID=30991 RepID=A0AAD5AT10_SILAS|nr:hypothetical protein C0J50_19433 [Silurus asotus]
MAYLQKVKTLERWCQENKLLLNISKTKELIVDFSTKQGRSYQLLNINGTPVERVDSFRYLGVHITQDLSWSCHTNTLVKKAWQHLYHLRCLRDFKLPSPVLNTFYICTIESVLTALCGKTRGGGLCVYINTEWCKNPVLVSTHCSSLLEFIVVRCRPFYLPREFTTAIVLGVYIPPSANAKEALIVLYGTISRLQNTHPDGLFIVAGDFNHANLRTVLSKFYQNVDFATRGENTLDVVYTNIRGAYRAKPRPHLGYSDHISVMLIPAYRPLSRCSRPAQKQVRTWPAGSMSALQDCFECTDWDMFREASTIGDFINLEEYTSTVTSYIGKCIDDVTISKTITTCSNQKPWMTAKVRAVLKTRDSAFRTGDKTALTVPCYQRGEARCRGYKKTGITLKLIYSTVVRVIQRFSKTGSTPNRPHKGPSNKSSPHASGFEEAASKKQMCEYCSIASEVAEAEVTLFNALTVRCTLQQVSLQTVIPEGTFSKAGFENPQTVC